MIKRIVHMEKISVRGEKRQFQIKLPMNAKRLLQLHTTANAVDRLIEQRRMVFQPEVGWLWLRISELRDVFYTEIVKLPIQTYNQTFEAHRPVDDFGFGTFWTQGKKEEFYDITADLDTNLLEGFYVDRLITPRPVVEVQNPIKTLRAITEYELRIYLTIEV